MNNIERDEGDEEEEEEEERLGRNFEVGDFEFRNTNGLLSIMPPPQSVGLNLPPEASHASFFQHQN